MSQLNSPDEKIKTDPSQQRRRPGAKKKAPKKITKNYLHNAGLYYLQRFAASTSHFRKVMMVKVDKSCTHHPGQDRETCARMLEDVIARFIELGLLDDSAYCRGTVQSLRRRGLSRRAIHTKLAAKGVMPEQTEQALAQCDEDSENGEDAELAAALRLARRRKIGPYRTSESAGEKDYQKALASMARAGFSFDICRRILKMERLES